jgi:hypothetical protein
MGWRGRLAADNGECRGRTAGLPHARAAPPSGQPNPTAARGGRSPRAVFACSPSGRGPATHCTYVARARSRRARPGVRRTTAAADEERGRRPRHGHARHASPREARLPALRSRFACTPVVAPPPNPNYTSPTHASRIPMTVHDGATHMLT